ncbi:uncharacterized protein LOC126687818 [Mercurialis annua]|uniref:uncharacterized protein LOC126687818 n=1 Tax=Mercurialis annua TaxID=3986 RepID=UPI0021602074|nr:uncharacterized protein LOC126687818 [Mercurialis annua]
MVHEKEVNIKEGQGVDVPLKKYVPPSPFVPKIPFPQRLKKQFNEVRIEKENGGDIPTKKYVPLPFVPKIPFPQRLKKEQDDQQFANFLDKVKKLQIHLFPAEALEQMLKYAKFLKDILTNNSKWKDNGTILLTENCSSIIFKKIPTKLKDSGSFSFPCVVGDMEFCKCLCDLGASINLTSLSVIKSLGLGEVKETSMLLQLVDQSIKRPYDIIEGVLVKVDKFIFSANFVVLDFEVDN